LKKKKLFLLFGSISLALMLVALPFTGGCAPTPEEEVIPPEEEVVIEPTVLTMVTILPKSDRGMTQVHAFVEFIEEQSDGELVIDWLGGPEVIDMFAQAEAAQMGVVDIALTPGAFYLGLVPAAEVLGFSNLNNQEQRESGGYDLMLEYHKEAGLYYFGPGPFATEEVLDYFYRLLTVEVETPQDLAGLRLGDGFIGMSGFYALGAVPTVVDIVEAYTAMERGVIDGYSYSLEGITDWGWHEVCPYFINHGFETNDSALIMNLDKWNSLSESQQDMLAELVVDFEPQAIEISKQQRVDEKELLRELGVEFIEFSPADAEYWRDIFPTAHWDDFLSWEPDIGPELQELFWKE